MAKAKGRPRKPGGEGVQVRIDGQIASMAKFVASERKITIAEYLSAILEGEVLRDWMQCVEAFNKRNAEYLDSLKDKD